MSHYLDISVPISETMLTWHTDPRVTQRTIVEEYPGRRVTISAWQLSSHTGTHVDTALHAGVGPATVEDLPFEALLGRAQVLDFRGTTSITPEALEAAGAGAARRVLLRTDNSGWIRTGPQADVPAHLSEASARFLIERGVGLVGIDGLSVDAPGEMGAHDALLSAGVVILETVDLTDVPAGDYELFCLPLRLAGADGAPARAVLRPILSSPPKA